MSKYTSKLSKLKITAMMLLILLASIWFALASQPVAVEQQPAITPDLIIMKRESFEITPEFEELLNTSLRFGDGRRVNWRWAEVA